ncbi:MAG: PilX N-terminal domain-containing pilus assembly protein [Cellvibrionaceae bacterium]|nr:PilX N-terminal domain-containing pilus assembly protein [Cellvibrionaceae bacterium]
MSRQYPVFLFRRRQRGTALIVSLIILAIVTLLGVTGMQSSNTELKLAASQRDRGVAFEAAEAALAIVEKNLADNPPSREQLQTSPFCSGSGCFNSSCQNGLCFGGDYKSIYTEYQCEVADIAAPRLEYWSDPTLDVWQQNTRHKTVKIDSLKTDVKYVVEFLCFVARDQETPFSAAPGEENNGVPLFRITALAKGNGGRASVALQSTYKVLNGF